MKIAVLVCGAYRTFDHCQKNIFDLFQNFDNVDYYMFTWNTTCLHLNKSNDIPEKIYVDMDVPEQTPDKHFHLFKKVSVENHHPEFDSIDNFFYTLQKGLELINAEDYDYIFKIRPDMVVENYAIPVEVINHQFFCHYEGWKNMRVNTHYISDWLFGFKPEFKPIFQNCFDNIPQIERGNEAILRHMVNINGINDIQVFYSDKYLVRTLK